MSLGNRIRGERLSLNWTQKELAKRVNVSPQVISNWERDYTLPDLNDIFLLAEVFDCSVDYLLGNEETVDTPVRSKPVFISTHEKADAVVVSPEEADFLRWIDENMDDADVFFYDFYKSPEEQKKQFMETMRALWEVEKKRGNIKPKE